MEIIANEVSYHVEIEGKGEPLVLLHGFTGSVDTWKPFRAEWKDFFQLIMIDIIGHGKTESPKNFKRYSMENATRDIIAILDSLKLIKVNLIGYSMGGRLALSIASLYPNRINKLILESSSPGLPTEDEREKRRISDAVLAESILENGIEKFVEYWENIPLFSSQKVLTKGRIKDIRIQRLQNCALGLANSLKGMGTGSQPSWWSTLSLLHLPILLICGKLDSKYCIIAKDMDALLPNSFVYQVEDAGHAIHVEQPQTFGKIVSEFLLTINF